MLRKSLENQGILDGTNIWDIYKDVDFQAIICQKHGNLFELKKIEAIPSKNMK